jgi:predicted PurR-regulated permease PerM
MSQNQNLSKDDLILLLESYKNSVEMNTLISQQLSYILEVLQTIKDNDSNIEQNIKVKIDSAIDLIEKIRDKFEMHEKEGIKQFGKILNRISAIYIALGSIVLSLFWMIYQLVDKYDILRKIAEHLGV